MNVDADDRDFQRCRLVVCRLTVGIDLDRLVKVRELVHSLLPNIVQHGAIAKAGLPKNFHSAPIAQAAE